MPNFIERRNRPRLIVVAPETHHPPIHPPRPVLTYLPLHMHSPLFLPRPAPKSDLLTSILRDPLEPLIVACAIDVEVGNGSVELDLTGTGVTAPEADAGLGAVGSTENVVSEPIGVVILGRDVGMGAFHYSWSQAVPAALGEPLAESA